MHTHRNYSTNYFLFFCLAASIALMYFIAQPFLAPLILAGVFAFLFQPLYRSLLNSLKGRAGVSAFLTTGAAAVIILIPLTILGTLIFREATGLYHTLASEEKQSISLLINNTVGQIRNVLPVPPTFTINIDEYVRQGLGSLVANLGAFFSGTAKLFLNLFVFLVAFYFFLKDGKKLERYFVELSPLHDSDDLMIITRLERAVTASIKGNLTIGLVQGFLTGIGFFIFGVPNPVLWGSVAAITALVPGIGTALVIIPAILFLFLTNETTSAVGLIVWGAGAVGIVDNLLGPRLVGQGMRLHPLVVFIAVLGGLAFFGPLGFLLGPLAVSLCIALIDIYFSLKSSNIETS